MAHPNGERREYILCGQVDENRWWCHAGSSSETGNVFDPADMELLDVGAPEDGVLREGEGEEAEPLRRRRAGHGGDLEAIVAEDVDVVEDDELVGGGEL